MKAFRFALMLATSLICAATVDAADLNVAWKNAAVYTDGSAMLATDIVSSTVSCGLNQTNLTLSTTAQGAVQSAVVSGALAGKTYVCGVVTNSKANGSSDIAFSNNVTTPAAKPSPPSGISLTVSATATTAYKMRQEVDGFSFVAIGEVPAGTVCDANHSADGYALVPRTSVKLTSRFDTMPLIVFARCS